MCRWLTFDEHHVTSHQTNFCYFHFMHKRLRGELQNSIGLRDTYIYLDRFCCCHRLISSPVCKLNTCHFFFFVSFVHCSCIHKTLTFSICLSRFRFLCRFSVHTNTSLAGCLTACYHFVLAPFVFAMMWNFESRKIKYGTQMKDVKSTRKYNEKYEKYENWI